MKEYNHQAIEKKWARQWQKTGLNKQGKKSGRDKCYVLDMFPYPSGDGLHVGHPRGYIGTDVYSRFRQMSGFNIIHPMGWDAFGLPAENYAIKHRVHPGQAVKSNIKRFKEQLSLLGLNYDWDREINTTDPEYYKWTQWIFLKLFERGLAYQSYEPINWCPSCQTGLANEDLENGRCERCGSEIEKKPMRQWVLRITDYADRLLKDLAQLDWPESVKESQRNWIGRSEGALIKFPLKGITGQPEDKHSVEVFTTRPDTIFGATYVAVSPELAQKWLDLGWSVSNEVKNYINQVLKERSKKTYKDDPEKTGVASGITAVNPASGEEIPVWITNYVLGAVGTGAIMAVPAHDERDFGFAKKYDLPIEHVVKSDDPSAGNDFYLGEGVLIGSGQFDGLASEEARKKITKFVKGKWTATYKLRDWVFSRQRYWGEPIPIIHCDQCGVVPVPAKDLPVKLPQVKSYAPTGTGESPLADVSSWVNVKCPKCQSPAKRETNTMPQWAGSSWYYLRYIDPKNKKTLVDKKKEKYWSPVDTYVGGTEHATRHLIYARFWHKFLYDLGTVNYPEPFVRYRYQGLIMAADGRKMSKRYGNVINPDQIVKAYGADTLRVYEMFMGPFDQTIAWDDKSIIGSRRFLEKVWRLNDKIGSAAIDSDIERLLHRTIKKVSDDVAGFSFNTAISALMILVNALDKAEVVNKKTYQTLLLLLAPFAPHLTEELWSKAGQQGSIHRQKWPQFDPAKLIKEETKLIIQVDNKVRDIIMIANDSTEAEIKSMALGQPAVKKWLGANPPQKVIYVKGKLINIIK